MTTKQILQELLDEVEGEMEEFASIEHVRWSKWQKWLHSLCNKNTDGSLTIPTEKVERWERQIATEYKDLSEDEKESDRHQVRSYLDIITTIIKRKMEN